ncbi:MAG: hypothetical protein D6675_15520 [Gemmatimonadetes bacterium]|nr:MAG: hypothetical protein D6675_15520 [Gemmatimonadota bacterium]
MSLSRKQHLLREYKAVSEFVDFLIRENHTIEDFEQHILEFLTEAETNQFEVVPSLIEKMKRDYTKPYVLSTIVEILKQYGDETVLDEVFETFIDPDVPDDIRAPLLELMNFYGIDTTNPELGLHFQDIDAVHRKALESVLEQLDQHEELAIEFLNEVHEMPREMKQDLIKEVTAQGEERALPLLAVFAEYPDAEVANIAIHALGTLRSPRALWVLQHLTNHQRGLKNSIERSLRKLQFAGIPAPTTDSAPLPFHECLLSNVDGRGSRMLFLSRQVDDDHYELVNFMLNEFCGIKDCMGEFGISFAFYTDIRQQMSNELHLVKIDSSYAIDLIRDALWWAMRNKEMISPAFILKRAIFGNVDLTPAPYEPDLYRYRLAEVQDRAEALLDATENLIDVDLLADWWLDIPEAYQFVKKKQRQLQRRGMTTPIVMEFIQKVIEPLREHFIRRTALTIEYMALDDETRYRESIELLLTVWLALAEWEMNCTDIPFFVELAEQSIFYVLDNIELGIDSPESFVPEYQ